MIELKREGLYIANGKNISVLIKVTGQTPYLDIPCGVLLNDMQNRNCVTVLDRNSPEIQDILSNPTQYVYDFPTVSDAINNKEGLETTEHERIEYSTETFNEWVNAYLRLREAYPDGYYVKTVIYLMKKGYAKSQADLIIKQIVNHIHRKCEL